MAIPDQPAETAPSPFEARILTSGERSARVVLSGELDLAAAPLLEEAVARALEGADEIVLDLSQVRFIDSTGISAVVAAVKAAQTSGVALMISSTLRSQVRRLFELVGMSDTLPLIDE
jgi:anti-sigma B factor antagonist